MLGIDSENLVTIVDDSEPMGDEDDGSVVSCEDVLEQLVLGFGIESAGGFVEEHNGAVAQQSTSDGDALCLTFAEAASLLAA